MKVNATSGATNALRPVSFALLLTMVPGLAVAQKSPKGGFDNAPQAGLRTDRDIPGDTNKYFGQRDNQFRDLGRRLAKIDLDADFNYDGVVDNDDPADNGAFQQTPPGLVLGTGELSKLVLRIRPYHLDFKGRAVVSLRVDGINRGHKSGQFASFEDEKALVQRESRIDFRSLSKTSVAMTEFTSTPKVIGSSPIIR